MIHAFLFVYFLFLFTTFPPFFHFYFAHVPLLLLTPDFAKPHYVEESNTVHRIPGYYSQLFASPYALANRQVSLSTFQ